MKSSRPYFSWTSVQNTYAKYQQYIGTNMSAPLLAICCANVLTILYIQNTIFQQITILLINFSEKFITREHPIYIFKTFQKCLHRRLFSSYCLKLEINNCFEIIYSVHSKVKPPNISGTFPDKSLIHFHWHLIAGFMWQVSLSHYVPDEDHFVCIMSKKV